MKITDYGLWFFGPDEIWYKEEELRFENFYYIYFNGTHIGDGWIKDGFYLNLEELHRINLRVCPRTPGNTFNCWWSCWKTPDNYLLTEADLEQTD